jgi:probable rRNA maturation factor
VLIIERPLEKVSPSGLQRFAHRAQRLAGIPGEVDILITRADRIRELNRRFRRKDKATDVLSFPRPDGGDIAISAEIAAANAVRYGHAAADELKILILHGMLHLAGYDHERDNGEMAARENALRRQLGLPDALLERSKISPQGTQRRQNAKGQGPKARS